MSDHNFAWAVVGLTWLAGIGAAVYLSMNHHPAFAVCVLIVAMCASFKSKDDKDAEDEE